MKTGNISLQMKSFSDTFSLSGLISTVIADYELETGPLAAYDPVKNRFNPEYEDGFFSTILLRLK